MLRESKFYKSLSNFKATAYAEGFGAGKDASEFEQLCAWQYILDNDLHPHLQGWFGRTVSALLEQGHIKPKDVIDLTE